MYVVAQSPREELLSEELRQVKLEVHAGIVDFIHMHGRLDEVCNQMSQ